MKKPQSGPKRYFKNGWMDKPIGEKLQILITQRNPKGGSEKVLLKMKKTIYGSVQAARAFWIELQKAFHAVGYQQSEADPCMYHRWDEHGNICIWLTWIDDCIAIGKESVVVRKCAKLMQLFDCDDVGPMQEYMGNKIEMGKGTMKLTQPVLLKSFIDEFDVKTSVETSLPAKAGQVLVKGKEKDVMSDAMKTKYCSGMGKLRYLATWSRPDILNAVREVSRHLKTPTQVHYNAMKTRMEYCIATAGRGRKIEPLQQWDGSTEFEFVVSSKSDSTYNQCPETRRSVLGNTTEVNGVPVITKSIMQETMKLLVTEAELDSAVTNVQDMLL
jgi:Reverse transcriptase (RNA-dependent DNA polymerase)